MKITKSIAPLLIGTIFGAGLVLSCSEDSPRQSDASTCDCPASEAPIAGRTVVIDGEPHTIAAGDLLAVGAACTPGMQFLSGSCTAADPTTLEDIALIQSGFSKTTLGWACAFKNNKLTAVQVKASVLCLKPAT
jgi:hypothetical protein